jgi:hypothetical protein
VARARAPGTVVMLTIIYRPGLSRPGTQSRAAAPSIWFVLNHAIVDVPDVRLLGDTSST